MDQIWETLQQAFSAWREDFALIEKLPQVAVALLVLLLTYYTARVSRAIIRRTLKHRKADAEASLLISRIAQWTIISLGILFAADQMGIDITAVLTGLGILGFTVGFALQDISKNFMAGILILVQQPFEIGDTLEVAGYTGTILTINLRDTEMRTVDGLHVRLPNTDVFTSPIINYTGLQRRRITLETGVATNSDLERVREVALESIAGIEGVLSEPEIDFRFERFGDSSIDLSIFYWYDERQLTYSQALDLGIRRIKLAFDQAEIVMPGPEQAVFVKELPSA